MFKKDLIGLVRQAQAERDPGKRGRLWRMVEEAGLPCDATVDKGVSTMDTVTCKKCGEEIPAYRSIKIRCGPNEVEACPECMAMLPIPEEKNEE